MQRTIQAIAIAAIGAGSHEQICRLSRPRICAQRNESCAL
jgi:hypothetical protein